MRLMGNSTIMTRPSKRIQTINEIIRTRMTRTPTSKNTNRTKTMETRNGNDVNGTKKHTTEHTTNPAKNNEPSKENKQAMLEHGHAGER